MMSDYVFTLGEFALCIKHSDLLLIKAEQSIVAVVQPEPPETAGPAGPAGPGGPGGPLAIPLSENDNNSNLIG